MSKKREPVPIFARRIYELRKERNMNQEQFADYIGSSRATVGSYENGGAPEAFVLARICEKLNVSSDYMLGCSDYRNFDDRGVTAADLGLDKQSIRNLKLLRTSRQLSKEETYMDMCYEVLNDVLSDTEFRQFIMEAAHVRIENEKTFSEQKQVPNEVLTEGLALVEQTARELHEKLCSLGDNRTYRVIPSSLHNTLLHERNCKKRWRKVLGKAIASQEGDDDDEA